jgi:hypothetical protein
MNTFLKTWLPCLLIAVLLVGTAYAAVHNQFIRGTTVVSSGTYGNQAWTQFDHDDSGTTMRIYAKASGNVSTVLGFNVKWSYDSSGFVALDSLKCDSATSKIGYWAIDIDSLFAMYFPDDGQTGVHNAMKQTGIWQYKPEMRSDTNYQSGTLTATVSH